MTLAEILRRGSAPRADIASHLDGLDPRVRVAECVELSKVLQKRLWTIASAEPGEAQELLSAGGTAIFAGRNSLGLFSRFEKRFARHSDSVVGYNQHPLGWLIGPGYFSVVRARGGLLFDYRHVPSEAPAGWPRVTSNTQGFASPVYKDLLDDVVWVAHDVLVGCARRGEVSLDSYFVLARA